jgi:hypothetical protein
MSFDLELAFALFCLDHIKSAEALRAAVEPPPPPPPPPPAYPVALVCFVSAAEELCASSDPFLLADEVAASFRALPADHCGRGDQVTRLVAQCAERCRLHRGLASHLHACLANTAFRLHDAQVFDFFLSCPPDAVVSVACHFLLHEARGSLMAREAGCNALRLLESLAPRVSGPKQQLLLATLSQMVGPPADCYARLARNFALRILEQHNNNQQ